MNDFPYNMELLDNNIIIEKQQDDISSSLLDTILKLMNENVVNKRFLVIGYDDQTVFQTIDILRKNGYMISMKDHDFEDMLNCKILPKRFLIVINN